METKSNLVLKLCKIMDECNHLKKTGYNKHQNYEYFKDDDIVQPIRTLLAKYKIFIFHSVQDEVKEGDLTKIRVEYTFVDGETGERFSVQQFGYGKDMQDKGLYKAYTGAHKYFLLRNFNLGSDQDPENDEESDKTKSYRGPAKQPSPGAKQTLPLISARPPTPHGEASPNSDDPGEMLTDKGVKIKDVWMKHRVKAIQKANQVKERLAAGDIPELWEQSLLDYGVENELITDA